jgi:Iron dependent repressor, N-terminal DNA binding domain
MNQKSGAARSLTAQGFTEKQGQYLAFIYTYSHMFRRPPAETDMQRHFQVSPPSVHQMIMTLSSAVNPASPEVSRSSSNQKTCPSWIGSKSTSHNHCDEVPRRPIP